MTRYTFRPFALNVVERPPSTLVPFITNVIAAVNRCSFISLFFFPLLKLINTACRASENSQKRKVLRPKDIPEAEILKELLSRPRPLTGSFTCGMFVKKYLDDSRRAIRYDRDGNVLEARSLKKRKKPRQQLALPFTVHLCCNIKQISR